MSRGESEEGRGSGRRLPSLPDPQTQLHLASRMIDSSTSSAPGTHAYGSFFLEYTMLAEYNLVLKQKIPGVYVMPSAEKPSVWYGVVFVRQGVYRDAVLRFTLTIPDNYPDGACPSVRFESTVFHPLIDAESGELDVQRQFPKWRRNLHHVWQVLMFARRVFYKLDCHKPVNEEAADLYTNDQEAFKRRVAADVALGREEIYNPPAAQDPHALCFSRWDPELHEATAKEILTPPRISESHDPGSSRGLSWMEPTTLKVFSTQPQ